MKFKTKPPKKFITGKGYQELVADITKIAEQAYVKGVDFGRTHFLNCFACECFECMTKEGSRIVYRKDGTPTGLDVDFTVINVKYRDYRLKNGHLRWRTTYRYICGLCGAEQVVCHIDEFSQKPKGELNE